MVRILFICHGNICRSVCAQMLLNELARRRGLEGRVRGDSAATSYEEIGNDIYPPMKRTLRAHGVPCGPHSARRIVREDYDAYDLLIGMDDENLRSMRRMWPKDPGGKLHLLMEYAGKPGREVADPWYTRDFEATWRDALAGCTGLLDRLFP